MSEAVSWPILKSLELRVLGVLVEKSKTTPDVYPMSINSLVTGCNQKSNREPIMIVEEIEVEETLEGMQPKGLVMRTQSGRVDRWRQLLYEAWTSSKVELAILAELMLRGPQTEGELRGRAARMEPIDDLEQLRTICKPLAERKLIVYLTPERSRGTMLTHGFHALDELQGLRKRHSSGFAAEPVAAPSPRASMTVASAPGPDRFAEAFAEIARLNAEVGQLRAELSKVSTQMANLQESLGIAPPNSSILGERGA